jgi:O-antigen/teichoic acid export membrane protein
MRLHLVRASLTQIYISLIGILLMPVYLRYLGGEAFGLVGFSIMLQAWIQMLDFGMSPVLSREMSRYRAGAVSSAELALILNSLEFALGLLALLVVFLVSIFSNWIATEWLSVAGISENELTLCVALIGLSGTMIWLSGLYRAALSGLERQKQVNGLTVGLTTLRYLGPVPLLLYVSQAPLYFFAFQAAVSVFSLWVFSSATRASISYKVEFRLDRVTMLAMFPMAGGMAFLSTVWVVVTQVDKLVLSGLLTLENYGYFMLATMAASGVLVLIPPMNQVVQPRLTILSVRDDRIQLVKLYLLATQVFAVAFFCLGGGLAFFAEPILRIWSGRSDVAVLMAPVLFWYALANSVTGLLVLPFMLQFAQGKLRWHINANLVMMAIFMPALIIAADFWGAIGTGRVQFFGNLLFLMLWIPVIHRRFLPTVNLKSLFLDTWVPGGVVLLSLYVLASLFQEFIQDEFAIVWIGLSCLFAAIVGIASGDYSRRFVVELLSGLKKWNIR